MENTPIEGAESLAEPAPVENVEAPKTEVVEEQKTYTKDDFERLEKQLQREQRRINRLTAAKYSEKSQNQILMEKLSQYEKAQAEKKDTRPNIDQFQSYDEYNEAVARWAARQEGKPQNAPEEAKPQRVPPQEAQWQKEKESEAIQQARQLSQSIPDFEETWTENGHFFDVMPYELEKALYQSQHPALAVYVLAKEGRLEELLEMNPQQAAYEIGRATSVGVSSIRQYAEKQQKPTAAPQPLSAPAKGTASGSKKLDDMHGPELLKFLRS